MIVSGALDLWTNKIGLVLRPEPGLGPGQSVKLTYSSKPAYCTTNTSKDGVMVSINPVSLLAMK